MQSSGNANDYLFNRHDKQLEDLAKQITTVDKSISGIDKNVAVMAGKIENIYEVMKNLDAQREKQIMLLEQKMDNQIKDIVNDYSAIKKENKAIQDEQIQLRTTMKLYAWVMGVASMLIGGLIAALPKIFYYVINHIESVAVK